MRSHASHLLGFMWLRWTALWRTRVQVAPSQGVRQTLQFARWHSMRCAPTSHPTQRRGRCQSRSRRARGPCLRPSRFRRQCSTFLCRVACSTATTQLSGKFLVKGNLRGLEEGLVSSHLRCGLQQAKGFSHRRRATAECQGCHQVSQRVAVQMAQIVLSTKGTQQMRNKLRTITARCTNGAKMASQRCGCSHF
jgi:hypothetical protein